MQETHMKIDTEVLRAGEEAQASGRLTPLIKLELWSKIQSRRLSEGKEEMEVQFSPPQRTPLTEEEEEKNKKRKESNKQAAHRCRERRKEKEKEREQELARLISRNEELRGQITEIEGEIQFYQGLLCVPTCNSVEENPASPEQQVPGLWTGDEDILESFL